MSAHCAGTRVEVASTDDTVTYRCVTCDETWSEELPQ